VYLGKTTLKLKHMNIKAKMIDFKKVARRQRVVLPQGQEHLDRLLNDLETNPGDSNEFATAFGEISKSSLYLYLAGNFEDFCIRFMGWPEGASKLLLAKSSPWSVQTIEECITAAGASAKSEEVPDTKDVKEVYSQDQPIPATPADRTQTASESDSSPSSPSRQALPTLHVGLENLRAKGSVPKPNLSASRVEEVPLDTIVVDKGFQCRAQIDEATVSRYAERMASGDRFPALIVFKIDGRLVLADGFHRCAAAQKAGKTCLEVEVREGNRQAALKCAIAGNSAHGLPWSNEDKRRVVSLALKEFPGLSDWAISDICKVSQPFVGTVRGELKTVMSSEPRIGRDGKRRKPPVKKTNTKIEPTAEADQPAQNADIHPRHPTREVVADESERPEDHHDESETEPTPNTGEYSMAEAWSRVSDFLTEEVGQCPDNLRQEFAKRLREFADAV
jgi:hypothetical protein